MHSVIIDAGVFTVFLYCLGDLVDKTELHFVLCKRRSNEFLPPCSDLYDKHQPQPHAINFQFIRV